MSRSRENEDEWDLGDFASWTLPGGGYYSVAEIRKTCLERKIPGVHEEELQEYLKTWEKMIEEQIKDSSNSRKSVKTR